ncbi:MAG: modification methylase [Clostridiales bacterium GWE2_32_10]|nr:MAG: modification methylase [Clostridiales bacterium GWE2_32_10]HBY19997.1 modification methylase [Clostridiales bacterium]
MKIKLAQPVLKWVGGKRQLLPEIKKHIPKNVTTYYEPFVGGGAVLFDIQPTKVVINDINEELINLYKVVKDDVEILIEELKKHKNESEYFYQIRNLDRDNDVYQRMSEVEKAARILYLNKTCYNGLFRVNNAGEFNTPFGKYTNPNIVNDITLRAVNKYFNKTQIEFRNCDFEDAVRGIRKGNFVYFDPPYDPVSDSSNFTGYTKGGFDKEQQIRLKKLCDKLHSKGIKFLLSNSATDFIKDLYKDYTIEIVNAKRAINSNGNKRGEVAEVLVKNYE